MWYNLGEEHNRMLIDVKPISTFHGFVVQIGLDELKPTLIDSLEEVWE